MNSTQKRTSCQTKTRNNFHKTVYMKLTVMKANLQTKREKNSFSIFPTPVPSCLFVGGPNLVFLACIQKFNVTAGDHNPCPSSLLSRMNRCNFKHSLHVELEVSILIECSERLTGYICHINMQHGHYV